jgi:hypothetical protein
MSRWETTSTLEAGVTPASVWRKAYADAAAWPKWNAEIKRASLGGPLALGASAKIVFGTGLRLRFRVVEFGDGRLFTDESRLPGARMGHRHLVEPAEAGGCRLTNTIYIEGPLAPLWRRIMGPAAARTLPDAQRAVVGLARVASPRMGSAEWNNWWEASGRRELRALLMTRWDPIGVNGIPQARTEYDMYLDALASLLRDGADAERVADYLADIESGQMGLPVNRGQLLDTANRAIDWYSTEMQRQEDRSVSR